MASSLKEQYDLKLSKIESQFKTIAQQYAQVTMDLSRKNSIIEELTGRISDLQRQLGRANQKIEHLEKQLRKANSVKSVYLDKYSSRHATPNLESGGIENINQVFSPRLSAPYNGAECSRPVTTVDRFEEARNNLKAQVQLHKRTSEQNHSTLTILPPLKPPVANAHEQMGYSQTLVRNKSAGSLPPQANAQMLHQIWQQRDKQISKLDELFENFNHRLKDYE